MAATNKSTRAGGYAPGSGNPPDMVAPPFTVLGNEGRIWLLHSFDYMDRQIKDGRRRHSAAAVITWAIVHAEHDDTTPQGELFAYMNQNQIATTCGIGRKTVAAAIKALTVPDRDGWSPLREIPGHMRGDRSTATAYALDGYQARTTGGLEPVDAPGRYVPNRLHG